MKIKIIICFNQIHFVNGMFFYVISRESVNVSLAQYLANISIYLWVLRQRASIRQCENCLEHFFFGLATKLLGRTCYLMCSTVQYSIMRKFETCREKGRLFLFVAITCAVIAFFLAFAHIDYNLLNGVFVHSMGEPVFLLTLWYN